LTSKNRAALWLVAGILAIAWFRLAIPGLVHGLDFGSASGSLQHWIDRSRPSTRNVTFRDARVLDEPEVMRSGKGGNTRYRLLVPTTWQAGEGVHIVMELSRRYYNVWDSAQSGVVRNVIGEGVPSWVLSEFHERGVDLSPDVILFVQGENPQDDLVILGCLLAVTLVVAFALWRSKHPRDVPSA
jgi:hypothetical protein